MKVKKILILGSEEHFSLERIYERAFKSLRHDVYLFHIYNMKQPIISRFIWKFLRFFIFYHLRNKILRFFKNKKKNYDLIIIFKGLYTNEDFLNKLRNISPKTKIVNIFTDNPFDINYFKDISNLNILKSINLYDHLFIYSKNILKKLKKKYPNKSLSYLPFGYDSNQNQKKNISITKRFDISFIGTADKERYEYIKYLRNFKIILAGEGWLKFKLPFNVTYVGSADYKKSYKLISQSLVSLNILRSQNNSSHNMKTFEIPSMGGLMLTKRNQDQKNFFPENRACLMYKDKKELKFKINKVIKNPLKFSRIKKNGYKISNKHSYTQRAKYILKKVFN